MQVGFTKPSVSLPGYFNIRQVDDDTVQISLRPDHQGQVHTLDLTSDEWRFFFGQLQQTFGAADGSVR